MEKKWRIAITIPWFGQDLKGGAEQQAWQIAKRLKASGSNVTVLSTCSKSFLDSWDKNYYKSGLSYEDGLLIKRFKVSSRNGKIFNRVVTKLLSLNADQLIPALSPCTANEEQEYWDHNINSPDLITYIAKNRDDYDGFIFLPYLFPLTVKGVEAARNKAFLQPCLHNECYAYLNKTAEAFKNAKALFFNSSGEYKLAISLYGEWIKSKSFMIGEGVEFLPMSSQKETNLPSQLNIYILCLGRKSREKNTHLVIEYFLAYKNLHSASNIKLVLAGPAHINVPTGPDIIDLGLVSEETKVNLISNCLALVNLSVNESFSRVIFEAWYAGKPVIVNNDCLATKTAVEESHGAGWIVSQKSDFISICTHLNTLSFTDKEEIKVKAQNFALQSCSWDAVINRYYQAFAKISQVPLSTSKMKKTILFVYCNDLYDAASQIDLKESILSIQRIGCNVILYIENPKILAFELNKFYVNLERVNSFYSNEIDTNIIFGQSRLHMENVLKDIKLKSSCKVYCRYFGEQWKINTWNEDHSKTLTCQYPMPFLQRNSYPNKIFENYNKSKTLNVLLLHDLKSNDLKSLVILFDTFIKKNKCQIQFLVENGRRKSIEELLETLGTCCATYQVHETNSTIPSYIYDVCDVMVIYGNVKDPEWQWLGAYTHGVPVLFYDNTVVHEDKGGFCYSSAHSEQRRGACNYLQQVSKMSPIREEIKNLGYRSLLANIPLQTSQDFIDFIL